MKYRYALAVFALLSSPLVVLAQDSPASASVSGAVASAASAPVPRLLRYSGAAKTSDGRPWSGTATLTFAIYAEQQDGTALWIETQNAESDAQGRYAVLLGSTRSEGMPVDLFTAGEPRWLGVRVELPGEVEQPRVLLVSVPYALKAGDAATLGGKPASAYALAESAAGGQTSADDGVASSLGGNHREGEISGFGTPGFLARFTEPDTIGNSALFENKGLVGIGTAYPSQTLDVFGSIQISGRGNGVYFPDGSFQKTAATGTGNGISGVLTPAGSGLSGGGTSGTLNLSLLTGCTAGQILKWNGSVWTCAADLQGSSLLTGVTAGTGLTGGGTVGNVTLALDTTFTDARYSQVGATNTFSGNQVFTGQVKFGDPTYFNPGPTPNPDGDVVSNGSVVMCGGNLTLVTSVSSMACSGTTQLALPTTLPGSLNFAAGVSTSSGGPEVPNVFSWVAEGVNNGTPSAASSFSLYTATNGNPPAFTGFGINQNGIIQFAPGQTFPITGAGSGTVTNVGSGFGLTGGPITTTGTLMIDTTVVPQLGAPSNTFTGSITASSFTGNGAGLSSVNALTLGGNLPSAFASTGANTFTGTQTINGSVGIGVATPLATLDVNGSINVPNTRSGSVGVISLGNFTFLHNFPGTVGSDNTFVGALAGNTTVMTGIGNTGVGFGALNANTSGAGNSAFGEGALFNNGTGQGNSALGGAALTVNTSGTDNSAFGGGALSGNTTGDYNSAFGVGALRSLTTGSYNIAIGLNAGGNISGRESGNIYIGNTGVAGESGIIRIGNNDLSVGPVQTQTYLVGNLNVAGTITCGSGCSGGSGSGTVTSVGSGLGLAGGPITTTGALMIDTTVVPQLGVPNTFTGSNTFTGANIFNGSFTGNGAGLSNVNALTLGGNLPSAFATTGANNFTGNQGITGNVSLTGSLTLPNTTSATVGVINLGTTPFLHNYGTSNTFVGQNAGNFSTTGLGTNTAIGATALQAVTDGRGNTAVGMGALQSNTSGSGNTAVGLSAGIGPSGATPTVIGSNNTFIGNNARPGVSTPIVNSTAIGFDATVSEDNALVLGSALTNIGIGTATPAFKLDVNGDANFSGVLHATALESASSLGVKASSDLSLQSGTALTVQSGTALSMTSVNAFSLTSNQNFSVQSVQALNLQSGTALGLTAPSGVTITGNAAVSGTLTMGGAITFAPGQIFPSTGTGGGTVTSVMAGAGLHAIPSNPITSTGTLTIDPTVVPQLGAGNNAFAGTITLGGDLALPFTSADGTMGVITVGGQPFLHNYPGTANSDNTFVGASAGNMTMDPVNAINNTAVGASALELNTTGTNNSAFGSGALFKNSSGTGNSGFGVNALALNQGGVGNSAFGYGALSNNVVTSANSAFGYKSLEYSQGQRNTAFGSQALSGLGLSGGGSGDSNIAIGQNAGTNLTSGSNNIYVGNLGPTLPNTMESGMIRIGDPNFQTATYLAGNVTISAPAGMGFGLTFPDGTTQTTAYTGGGSGGGGGTVTSVMAGTGLTSSPNPITSSGTISIASGGVTNSLLANPSFTLSVGTGLTGGGTVALGGTGTLSLATINCPGGDVLTGLPLACSPLSTLGIATLGANTFSGDQTITGNVSASGAVTVGGNLALPNTTSPTTASPGVGVITLGGIAFLHNYGIRNTFVGGLAGNTSTSGPDNTGVGFGALGSLGGSNPTMAFSNSAFGSQALTANTTGLLNSAFGAGALASNTEGLSNSAFGEGTLAALKSGSNNIAIGKGAGGNLFTNESFNIYIGNVGTSSESNTIRIGDGVTQTATYITGISGATIASGTAVMVASNGQLGTITSSRRFKHDIADMGVESDLLMKLRPVAFYYKPELDTTQTRQYGLVAEEVAKVAPGLVVFDKNGEPETVRYHFVNAMLLNEVQKQQRLLEEQQRATDEQRRANEEQKSTIARQQEEIQDLAARLAKLEALLAPQR